MSANFVECKKHRESSRSIPAKDLRLPARPLTRPPRPRHGTLGSRQRKARERGDPRLETGIASFSRREEGVWGSHEPWMPVAGPDLTTRPSKSGQPLQTSFARRAFVSHHEWVRKAGWNAPVSTGAGQVVDRTQRVARLDVGSSERVARLDSRKVSGDSTGFIGCRRAVVVC